MEEPIHFADILTPNELQMNMRFVKQMMMNHEIVLGYVEPSSNKIRQVEDIRIQLFNRQVEVKSDLDRDWRPVSLDDVMVQLS
jgi:hypothetical protein